MVMPEETIESEYDHDFEAEELCSGCEESLDNCSCEDEQEPMDGTACAICGADEDDPCHQDED
jgi:hypothetical protein